MKQGRTERTNIYSGMNIKKMGSDVDAKRTGGHKGGKGSGETEVKGGGEERIGEGRRRREKRQDVLRCQRCRRIGMAVGERMYNT